MGRTIKTFKNKVNEKARLLSNQIGFYEAKKEFNDLTVETYLETQKKLKEKQDMYSFYGVMDYYDLQFKLLESCKELLKRTDEQWLQSIRVKQSYLLNN